MAADPLPAGFGPRLKRLGSESLVYGLSTVVGRLLNYILQPYYAHHFDPSLNGVQSIVYVYSPIIGIVLYLGMDIAYMRNAASTKNASLRDQQRAFSMSLAVVAAIGGLGTALAMLGTSWLAPLVRLDAESFRYMMAIVYTDALLAIPYAHLRMTNRATRYATLKILFVVISIALNVFLIGQLHWGVPAIFFSNLAANLVVLALFLGEIGRFFRPGLLRGAPWGALWAYALPVIPATLAVMVVEGGDRIVLNYLPDGAAALVYHMTPKDVVGIYSFNYKLGVAMLLVVQMFRLAWTPFFMQHAREARAPELYSRVLTALMLVCAAVFLSIALLLPALARVPIVHDYVKADYWLGLPIVPVILLGYVFSGMYAVVTAGLYIERKTHVLAWIAGAGAVLNIGICIVAAPRWGMVSVAWATPAAYALMAALGAWQANRVFPVPFEWRRLAYLGALVAVLFGMDRQWRQRASRLSPPWGLVSARAAARPARAARGDGFLPARRDARAALDAFPALNQWRGASARTSRRPGMVTNRASWLQISRAPPSKAHRAIWRSNTRFPRTWRSAASWARRSPKPVPGDHTWAPASASAARNRRASSGVDGRPLAEGCVTTPQNSATTGAAKPHPSEAAARSMAARAAPVLGRGRSMRVDEQVRVERDHRPRRRPSCMASRSATSMPRGTPPLTVTQAMAVALRLLRAGLCSCARKPVATRSRKGRRSSAARFLAATNSSSGRSMVVFIWLYSLP